MSSYEMEQKNSVDGIRNQKCTVGQHYLLAKYVWPWSTLDELRQQLVIINLLTPSSPSKFALRLMQ